MKSQVKQRCSAHLHSGAAAVLVFVWDFVFLKHQSDHLRPDLELLHLFLTLLPPEPLSDAFALFAVFYSVCSPSYRAWPSPALTRGGGVQGGGGAGRQQQPPEVMFPPCGSTGSSVPDQ